MAGSRTPLGAGAGLSLTGLGRELGSHVAEQDRIQDGHVAGQIAQARPEGSVGLGGQEHLAGPVQHLFSPELVAQLSRAQQAEAQCAERFAVGLQRRPNTHPVQPHPAQLLLLDAQVRLLA
ncbi:MULTISPECIES: hypothetical protein [unclassified Nonomuraea]|uniref:hypothetical protein n=1 Tax=unclassified Nonomuraea TaxID=2593643 RepID=UPI0033FAF27B